MISLRPSALGFPSSDPDAIFPYLLKAFLPIPVLLGILPLLWWVFRKTWRELDEEAQVFRGKLLEEGKSDMRPLVAAVMCAMVLALQDYYGGRSFFDEAVRPSIERFDAAHHAVLRYKRYEELFNYGWWAVTRIGGYMLPLVLWKAFFRKDSVLDFGLRTKDFFKHAWIYGLFLAVVLPAMLVVSRQPDFGTYYPFYKLSSRSWWDFLLWESIYFSQFFALEVFFRGFWLRANRSFGSGAIFAMAVPYCMIHFGKPYLEACGAIIAGIALGSLSMRTKSIYQGFLVHVTVAGLMDILSLHNRHALPTQFWPS